MAAKAFLVAASRIKEENFPIRYVALYETETAFGDDAKIKYYGEVKTIEIVTGDSCVLGDAVGADPNEQYYLLRVKSWKSLEYPIKPKEKGFYQMYTNLFLLQNSSFVNELFLRSEEEYRLYSELKRRTDKASIAGDEERGVSWFEIGTGGNMVMFEGGKIWTKVNGVKAEYCSVKDFANKPNMRFRGLMEYLRKLRKM